MVNKMIISLMQDNMKDESKKKGLSSEKELNEYVEKIRENLRK